MKLEDILFFYIRHAETKGNKDNVYRGWSNAPEAQLDDAGRDVAANAGRYLSSIGANIQLIVSDSLDRVQETIELVAESFPDAKLEFVRALHPLDMGDFTLKSKEKHPVEPYLNDPKKRIPGGDTVEEFNQRQWGIFKSIFQLAKDFPGGKLLVAGHGSNVAFLNNHVFSKTSGKIGYEGLVDPGGIIAVTRGGLVPLTRVRGKRDAKKDDLVQINDAGMPPKNEWAIEVPKGGSSCKTCKFLGKDEKTCVNKDFIAWEGPNKPAGSDKLPLSYDRYCSVWYLPAKGVLDGK